DTSDTSDTSTEHTDTNDKDGKTKNVDNMTDMTLDKEKRIPQNNNIITKIDTKNDIKTNGHSLQVSEVSVVSGNGKESIPDPIHRRNPNSDIWECKNCAFTGDIWFMKKHPCKYNKKSIKKIK
ncbi:MAG TPA: hypothetical protein VFK40_10535, partial [Nitrososphaeraceae archaeon]|nr:hypothetical protein [Nitrososphaeraceae archaeon]